MPLAVNTDDRKAAFEAALAHLDDFVTSLIPALPDFKRAFGRNVTPSFLAELYAARHYKLTLLESACAFGADATDAQGGRYQIKYRSPGVLNVDINNFEFDHIVLINIDANYALAGIWRLTVAQVRGLCKYQEKFRKFQVTQARFKAVALQRDN
jgi:hypothetical protein